ncbi:MAG: ABC transporter ATP-binding protein [Methanospirillum sp.]
MDTPSGERNHPTWRRLRALFAAPPGGAEAIPYRTLLPFLAYARPVWRLFAGGLVAGIAVSLLQMTLPLATKYFIDSIVSGNAPVILAGVPVSLPVLVVLLGAVGVMIMLFGTVGSYFSVRFTEEYTFLLQADLYGKILAFHLSYFRDRSTGYLLSRLNSDVGYLHYVLSGYLTQVVTQVVSLVVVFRILAYLNLGLTLLLLLFVPLYLLVNVVFIPRVRAFGYRERDASAFVYRDLGEVITGIEVIKAHAAEEREYARLLRTMREAVETRVMGAVYSAASGQIRYGLNGLVLLVLFWFGGRDVLSGAMTVGDFVAFAAYIASFSLLLSSLISSPLQLQPALISAARVSEILALAPEPGAGGYRPAACEGALAFRDVDFAYRPDEPVLASVSLAVPAGRAVGIVGRTGAGKTTLVNLLLKFNLPQKGEVTLDGRDLRDLDSRWLREQVALVSQDLFLFHATIEENIRYSRPSASFEDIVRAAEQAGVHDEVLRMPDGYRTVVGERGAKLSGGQRQRIGIARAFLKDAPILVLDEPTSHLDPTTRAGLEATLAELVLGRTTVFVTHQEGLLSLADEVYRLRDGALERVDAPTAAGGEGLDLTRDSGVGALE